MHQLIYEQSSDSNIGMVNPDRKAFCLKTLLETDSKAFILGGVANEGVPEAFQVLPLRDCCFIRLHVLSPASSSIRFITSGRAGNLKP
jgi:hypothetical protein